MKIRGAEIQGPRKVAVVEDTVRDPGAGEVQLKSLYSGISHGTEMNVYRGDSPMLGMAFDRKTKLFLESEKPPNSYPLRYGYSSVGEVVKVGEGVTELKKGDVVFCCLPHMSGHVVSAKEPVKLPKGVDPQVGIFLPNLGTTFNGVMDANLHIGECVVIFGQGILGQFAVQWAKMSGAGPVVAVELNEKRLRMSKEVSGADVTFSPKKTPDVAMAVRELTGSRGADVAIELSASDRALNEAIRTVCYNGKVIVLSWYAKNWANVFPGREFHHNRVQLICSQTWAVCPELSHRWSMKRVGQVVIDHLPRLNLKPLITHVVDIKDAAEAYKMIDEGREDVMQVVFKY